MKKAMKDIFLKLTFSIPKFMFNNFEKDFFMLMIDAVYEKLCKCKEK